MGLGRIIHWGPLTAVTIINWITVATLYCNTMLYPPAASLGGFLYTALFLVLSGLTLYHFLQAMYGGPGYLPMGWQPDKSPDIPAERLRSQLQFCDSCQGFKAPRAHHCRKCSSCVLKMDHHCPWINNCVGHFNHGHFTAFLGSAVCGCLISCITLSFSLYYGLNRSWYEYYGTGTYPRVVLTVWSLMGALLGLGLAIGVVIAVGLLLFFQLRSIVRNQTGIEDWILEKANYRHRHSVEGKFVFPYNLGRLENIRQVLSWSCTPKGDGIVWNIVEGTDQYTLTREQLCQKADKRSRSREYEIIHNYSGAWFPISQGLSVCCRPPCTDEPRIKLIRGDRVYVTRWKKHWLYGDKVNLVDQVRVRGWFPRRISVEVYVHDPHCQQEQDSDDIEESPPRTVRRSKQAARSAKEAEEHRSSANESRKKK